jgi:hypothetical protein
MTSHVHKITTHTIDSHPDPDLVYDWVRSNWHDLGDYNVQECMDTLKGFCKHFDLELKDWCISSVPDRGEGITVIFPCPDYSGNIDTTGELAGVRLFKYINNNYLSYRNKYTEKIEPDLLAGNCPFTGVCWDESMLDPMREFMRKPTGIDFDDLVQDCFASLLKALHNETEYQYSDEGLRDHLSINEYEFTTSGEFYQ